MMTEPVVIVGSGLAGWTTARELRKLDQSAPLVLVAADAGDFYSKPMLSNGLALGKNAGQLVNTPAEAMAAQLGVTLHCEFANDLAAKGYAVTVIDPMGFPLSAPAYLPALGKNNCSPFTLNDAISACPSGEVIHSISFMASS
ncbi:MAG: hypothetical protein HYZ19_02270 [Rhodocyclales bacterium]|nr:hypothetical protein [Rhodocyclales bacterium]